jgi:hypothetical protein
MTTLEVNTLVEDIEMTTSAADRRRYDVNNPHFDAPKGVLPHVSTRPIVQVIADDKVILDIDAMELGRPYTYRLGGEWLAAVKRANGQIDFVAIR